MFYRVSELGLAPDDNSEKLLPKKFGDTYQI